MMFAGVDVGVEGPIVGRIDSRGKKNQVPT